ncbi:MAG: carboxymethylenebutenolidase [Bradymonadia bacterium]
MAFAAVAFAGACSGAPAVDDESVEYANAMAAEHADETTDATPATGTIVPIGELRPAYFGEVAGYVARPPGGAESLGGVILVHEWWGLNENIEAVAERLASEGFTVLAVDMYLGERAEDAEGARALMMQSFEDPAAMAANIAAASSWLAQSEQVPDVTVMGYCYGGGVSLSTAMNAPSAVDAAIVYYGHIPDDLSAVAAIDDPMLLHFGELDGGIPLESVRRLEGAMADAPVGAMIHVYEGAEHAFANPSGQRYQAAAAELSWERTLEFLRQVESTTP